MPRPYALCFAVGLLLTDAAFAQVKVTVQSDRFPIEAQIVGTITNKTGNPISYCIEVGQTSPHAGSTEATPSPFLVEQRGKSGWNALLLGPDIGSSRQPATLNPRSTVSFPFRLNNPGETRLSLRYRVGEQQKACDLPAKGSKTAKSINLVVAN
jgi:hypothetical protein